MRVLPFIGGPCAIRCKQRWSVADGETAGHSVLGTKKLRSCDVDFRYGQTDVAAPKLHHPGRRFPRARALGYLTQLLRSQSHRPPDLPPIDGRALITSPETVAAVGSCSSTLNTGRAANVYLCGITTRWSSNHFQSARTSLCSASFRKQRLNLRALRWVPCVPWVLA
jgi:hypothetical protein